ncbi:MAG: CAP domain-containing protein [Proteobacteria bacterium]|nr:CAP domain-containing protein [Pseudomonadota bacterium]
MRFLSILFMMVFSNILFANTLATKDYVAIDSANQKAILFYVNKHRASKGLRPLKLNNVMSSAATIHSRDMARHSIPFGHKHFDKRIKRLYGKIKNCQAGSENVAYNYKDGQDVVKNWLTSRLHRRNIEGNFNLTGIGLARDSRGKLYFTQIFLRTKN